MSKEKILSQLHVLESELHDQLRLAKLEGIMLLVTSTSIEEASNCVKMRFDEIKTLFNKRVSLILDEYSREEKELEVLLDKNMEILSDPNEAEDVKIISKSNLDMINIKMEMSDKEKEALMKFSDNINIQIEETKNLIIGDLRN